MIKMAAAATAPPSETACIYIWRVSRARFFANFVFIRKGLFITNLEIKVFVGDFIKNSPNRQVSSKKYGRDDDKDSPPPQEHLKLLLMDPREILILILMLIIIRNIIYTVPSNTAIREEYYKDA